MTNKSSKQKPTWEKLLKKAKSSWRWEQANAGNNLQWNLYQLRKHRGWTQRELGRRLGGVAQSHIVRHETWGYMPSMDSLAKYAHLYNVTVADLLGEPMHFPPHKMFNDSGEVIGEVSYLSTAHTINTTASFKS